MDSEVHRRKGITGSDAMNIRCFCYPASDSPPMGNSTWPSHWGTTPPHSQSMGPGEADPISPPSRSRREHGQAEQILVCLGSPARTSGNDKLSLHSCGRMSAWSFWEVPCGGSLPGNEANIEKNKAKRRKEWDQDLITLSPWVQPCLKLSTLGPSTYVSHYIPYAAYSRLNCVSVTCNNNKSWLMEPLQRITRSPSYKKALEAIQQCFAHIKHSTVLCWPMNDLFITLAPTSQTEVKLSWQHYSKPQDKPTASSWSIILNDGK